MQIRGDFRVRKNGVGLGGGEGFSPLLQRNPAWAPGSEQRSPSVYEIP